VIVIKHLLEDFKFFTEWLRKFQCYEWCNDDVVMTIHTDLMSVQCLSPLLISSVNISIVILLIHIVNLLISNINL